MNPGAASIPDVNSGYWHAEAPIARVGNDFVSLRRDASDPPLRAAWRFLCLIQIANFTALRRRLGRIRADRLARDVAERVGQVVTGARMAIVARDLIELIFEGDERAVVDRMLAALNEAFGTNVQFEHEAHRLDIRLGAAAAPALGCDEVRLVEEAEAALTAATPRQPAAVRDLTSLDPVIDHTMLSRELPRAIASAQLFLQYQPKVHLRRQEITGVEALVRWDHPRRGLILPSDFIPAAEESGHIGPLTLWTLRQAITDQRALAEHGHDIPVYVNIAGVLLGDAQFVHEASELMGGGGCRVGFEITETSVIRDPESAIANLNIFAGLGIAIAIDDYGAGLSSLAYLKRLPARELKIDKLFVTQLTSSNRDPLIVRSTIDLAHALEMEVTAEGVEDAATQALLSVMGCDMAQGYLISRPVNLPALLLYLDDEMHLQTSDVTSGNLMGFGAAWRRP